MAYSCGTEIVDDFPKRLVVSIQLVHTITNFQGVEIFSAHQFCFALFSVGLLNLLCIYMTV